MPRDVDHFIRFTRLLELERQAERSRIAQEKETLPLAELEARGLVLDVETTEQSAGLGGTFMHESKRRLSTRLGPGDLLAVSPRKAELDSPPTGTVVSATRASVVVAFDQPPPPWMGEGRLRLDVTGPSQFDTPRGEARAFAARAPPERGAAQASDRPSRHRRAPRRPAASFAAGRSRAVAPAAPARA